MTEYYKVGTEPVIGEPAVTLHFGGRAHGTIVTVFEPLEPSAQLVSEFGQPRTLAELLAEAGRGKLQAAIAQAERGTR